MDGGIGWCRATCSAPAERSMHPAGLQEAYKFTPWLAVRPTIDLGPRGSLAVHISTHLAAFALGDRSPDYQCA